MKYFIWIISILFSLTSIAQDAKKSVHINRVEKAPLIDGVLDDEAWKNAGIAADFVMFRPRSNEPEPNNIKSVVKIVYDDEAIYFGAYLHDDKPEDIPMEFQTRDNFGNADFFGVVLNPQNDGQNQVEFFVMSTGNQNDAMITPSNGEDFSWDAVWKSSVQLVDDGWIVEMKIPYAALRFSNEKVQTWGLNFHRQHRNTRDQYSWNFIDREKGDTALYDGVMTGIEDIEPPLRLSFNPYISASTASVNGDTKFDWTAGLDLKYGITENFTLDATLIPDFGQVGFDDITLNLGPFEQRYSEKRAFFTEGTDLFNKGDFFESRRIGSSPTGDVDLGTGETIEEYPNKVDILNIIKISGRTKNGLGIGVLNAITKKTNAIIKKTELINNEAIISFRKEEVEPLANYNVLVLDQQFNKNSSVSLVNTNVIRNGHFRDANVTGLLYDIRTKENDYGVSGGISMSNVYNGNGKKPITGLQGDFEIGKISGNHQYDIGVNFSNNKYNKNDLGFQRTNNDIEYTASYSYRIFEPKGIFNNYGIYFWGDVDYLMKTDKTTASYATKPNLYVGNGIGASFWSTTKKQLSVGANINTSIGKQYDYYEPRVAGRFYEENPYLSFNNWISSDYSKKFALNLSYYFSFRLQENRNYFSFNFSPRYRINDKITLQYSFSLGKGSSSKGYVDIDANDTIIFGNRDSKRITNTISTKYNFSTKAAVSLSLRQNWQPVKYDTQYYKLEYDGTLSNSDYTGDNDINFNTWNLDLNFNWEFAPGSQFVALYRNNIFNQNENSEINFTDNLDNLFKDDLHHVFSVKLIYYLDYNKAKTWL